MKRALGFLLFLTATPLHAQDAPVLEEATVVVADGKETWPVAFHHLAVGFQVDRAHHHVSISARLGNGGGRAEVDAYLMREVGSDATADDEIARTALELSYPFDGWVDIFNDVELEKGKYWLVLGKPKEANFSSLNWFAAQFAGVMTQCGAHLLGSQSFAFESDAADYLPASKFEKKYTPYAYQIEVTELRPAGAIEQCTQTVSAGRGSSK